MSKYVSSAVNRMSSHRTIDEKMVHDMLRAVLKSPNKYDKWVQNNFRLFSLTPTLAERPLEAVWLPRAFLAVFNSPISSTKNDYTNEKDFYNICTLQMIVKIYSSREQNHFSLAVWRISPKNQNQDKSFKSRWKSLERYVLLNGPLRIY